MGGGTSLYVATGRGVFLTQSNGAAGEAHALGLEDKGGVRWILADCDDPARVWAATERGGVWRSEDGGRSWAEKNEGLVYKHAYSLAQHPLTGALYVGTEPACIFRSDDRGDHWTELETLRKLPTRKDWTFPGPPYVPHVRGLGLCRSDPDVIFGAVEEGWLIRSTDGGASWDNLKDGTDFDSHTVTVLPDNPMAVVTTSGDGLFRSEDGGESFADVNAGIANRYLTHVAVHPDRPAVLYTAGAEVPPPHWSRAGGPGAAFYRSEDAGRSWHRLTGGLPDRLEAAPRAVAGDRDDPEAIYVGLHDGDIWASADGGEGFVRIASGLPPVLGIAAAAR